MGAVPGVAVEYTWSPLFGTEMLRSNNFATATTIDGSRIVQPDYGPCKTVRVSETYMYAIVGLG